MKTTAILLASALMAACEFVTVGVPPLPGVPVAANPGTGSSASTVSVPIAALSTPQLCGTIAIGETAALREAAWNELDARATFTEQEMARIAAREVGAGMTPSAVLCVLGPPRRALTRSDDYDLVFVYGNNYISESGSVETRVYFEENLVVRVDNPDPRLPQTTVISGR